MTCQAEWVQTDSRVVAECSLKPLERVGLWFEHVKLDGTSPLRLGAAEYLPGPLAFVSSDIDHDRAIVQIEVVEELRVPTSGTEEPIHGRPIVMSFEHCSFVGPECTRSTPPPGCHGTQESSLDHVLVHAPRSLLGRRDRLFRAATREEVPWSEHVEGILDWRRGRCWRHATEL
jgi:hypothetical protein